MNVKTIVISLILVAASLQAFVSISTVEDSEGDITWTDWDSDNSLPGSAGNYRLTKDVTLAGTWNVPTGNSNLDLNNHTITCGQNNVANVAVIKVGSGITLDIYGTGGGTITHASGAYGGGITVEGTLTLNEGSISGNNTWGENGGGVYVDGDTAKFFMNGGSVSNNSAAGLGGGVYLNKGTFTMTGGTISGNTVSSSPNYGGGVYNLDGTFTMTGGTIGGTSLSDANDASSGGGVYITSNAKFFMSGGSVSYNKSNSSTGGGVYNVGTFELSGTGSIISGNTGKWGAGVYSKGTFTMSGGKITGNSVTSSQGSGIAQGGGVYLAGSSTLAPTFTMSGGTITGNSATQGGGVYITGASTYLPTFTMSGGTITGNDISGSTDSMGGGIYNNGAILALTGGSITGNKVAKSGGGVYQPNSGTLNLSGSIVISGNTVGNENSNLHFGSNNGILSATIVASFSEGASIHVTLEADDGTSGGTGTFTNGYTTYHSYATPSKWFTSDQGNVIWISGNEVSSDPATGISTLSTTPTTGQYQLTADVNSGNKWQISSSVSIYLDLNGHKIEFSGTGSQIVIDSGCTLTIDDTQSGGTITHVAGINGEGIYNKGTLMLYGGTISGNTSTGSGGGVNSEGTFTMTGGTISGNTSTGSRGGGVYVYQGTFTMTGGEIKENGASDGAGVYLRGTFDMSAGSISGNTATACGGGVFMEGGTFNLSGTAAIDSNTAKKSGGGVSNGSSTTESISGGTLNISGGTISNNTSDSYGGGVYNRGTLTMTGGTINNNTAATGGGGIVNTDQIGSGSEGILNMSGTATITGNRADKGGGITNGGTFTMSGGTISNNTATSTVGGGVENSVSFMMTGGTITGNKATTYGGGVYYGDYEWMAPSLSLSGSPVISDNVVGSEQDNLYITSSRELTITAAFSTGAEIYVTLASKTGVFTSGYKSYNPDTAPSTWFISDQGYVIGLEGNEAKINGVPVESVTFGNPSFTYLYNYWDHCSTSSTSGANTLDVTVTPSDQTLQAVTCTSSDVSVVTVSYDGSTMKVTVTPLVKNDGQITITITATDAEGTSVSDTYTVSAGVGAFPVKNFQELNDYITNGSYDTNTCYVDVTENFTTDADHDIPGAMILTVGDSVTLTNGSGYTMTNGGTVVNNGTVVNMGTFTNNGSYSPGDSGVFDIQSDNGYSSTSVGYTGLSGTVMMSDSTFEGVVAIEPAGNITVGSSSVKSYAGGIIVTGTATASHDVKIQNVSTSVYGVLVSGATRVSVTECTFGTAAKGVLPYPDVAYAGLITIDSPAGAADVSSNTVYGDSGTDATGLVFITPAGDITVSDNTFGGIGHTGVRMIGVTSNQVTVSGNTISFANYVDSSNYAGRAVEISGNNTSGGNIFVKDNILTTGVPYSPSYLFDVGGVVTFIANGGDLYGLSVSGNSMNGVSIRTTYDLAKIASGSSVFVDCGAYVFLSSFDYTSNKIYGELNLVDGSAIDVDDGEMIIGLTLNGVTISGLVADGDTTISMTDSTLVFGNFGSGRLTFAPGSGATFAVLSGTVTAISADSVTISDATQVSDANVVIGREDSGLGIELVSGTLFLKAPVPVGCSIAVAGGTLDCLGSPIAGTVEIDGGEMVLERTMTVTGAIILAGDDCKLELCDGCGYFGNSPTMKDGTMLFAGWIDTEGTIVHDTAEYVNDTGASVWAGWKAASSGSGEGTRDIAQIFGAALQSLSDNVAAAVMLAVIGIAQMLGCGYVWWRRPRSYTGKHHGGPCGPDIPILVIDRGTCRSSSIGPRIGRRTEFRETPRMTYTGIKER